jgi:hypothetical protein
VAGIRKSYFRDQMEEFISETMEAKFTGSIGIDTTEEGHLIIVVEGLTVDEDGDITMTEREFDFEGRVTFTVSGKVTARSADEAREFVEELLSDATVSLDGEDFVDDASVSNTEVEYVA